jgi:predicted nucleotidyltransferase component of viral defense system
MHLVLNEFFKNEMAQKFYLAGGTALSLQLGHRQSIDLDFFSATEDIALMKMDALLSRANRKDFYDLYFICKNIPLKQLFSNAHKKISIY